MHKPEEDQHISDPVIRQARQDAYTYSIPRYVYQAYRSQYHAAKNRGIDFRFTLVRWHLWWKTELDRIGPDARRGNKRGEFMMCRIGDEGAYEVGNVYAGTQQQNATDAKPARSAIQQAMWDKRIAAGQFSHLRDRKGEAHPRSRAVVLPDGRRFASITEAGRAHGMTRQAARQRVLSGAWAYETPPSDLPVRVKRPRVPRAVAMPIPKLSASEAATQAWLRRKANGDHGHLAGKSGDAHPRSRAVVTSEGVRFGSISEAARAAGITRASGFERVRRGVWRYAT